MPISPLQAATDVLLRADALLKHADTISDPLLVEDVQRAVIAQGVAAIDTYLHWAIADAPLNELHTALRRLPVAFGDLVDLSEAMVQNRQKIRPKVRARGVLERVIRSQTFQSSRGVEDAMLLLGVRKAFNKISTKMQPHEAPGALQEHLNRIVNRRNQIVHEGDLQRQSRPQQIKRDSLDRQEIAEDLAWISRFVAAIDSVLN